MAIAIDAFGRRIWSLAAAATCDFGRSKDRPYKYW